MALYVLTSSSPGAPTLNGVNGSACTVLDWALNATAGWAIEYTGTNSRVYRPAFGNRFRMHVNHDSATSGAAQRFIVRGCENASDSVTLVDPFPTVAQIANANSNWLASTTANATARTYALLIDDGATSGRAFVHMLINSGGSANAWQWGFWGDYASAISVDTFNTACIIRNFPDNSTFSSMTQLGNSTGGAGQNHVYNCRSVDGTIKSSIGSIVLPTTSFGVSSGPAQPGAGYGGGIDHSRVQIADRYTNNAAAGTSGMLLCRGWLPNIHNPMHSASNTGFAPSLEDFTDTAWAVGALFRIYTESSGGGSWLLIEETDTWYPPSD